MKIKHLLSVGLMTLCMAMQAETMYLIVEMKDNKNYNFLLADKPVVTFENGALVVNGKASTSYVIDNVKNCHFVSELSSAEDMKANDLQIIYVDENTLKIQNADANVSVQVMNVSGISFSNQKTDTEGTATLQLPSQKGVYVVTVGKQSFKIIRK